MDVRFTAAVLFLMVAAAAIGALVIHALLSLSSERLWWRIDRRQPLLEEDAGLQANPPPNEDGSAGDPAFRSAYPATPAAALRPSRTALEEAAP